MIKLINIKSKLACSSFFFLQADSDDSSSKSLSPLNAVLGSLAAPATNLLPLYGYIYSATVVSSMVQIFAGKAKEQFNTVCCTFYLH
jgi:hypothetical protein